MVRIRARFMDFRSVKILVERTMDKAFGVWEKPQPIVISSEARNLFFLTAGKQQIPRRCAPRNDKGWGLVYNRNVAETA